MRQTGWLESKFLCVYKIQTLEWNHSFKKIIIDNCCFFLDLNFHHFSASRSSVINLSESTSTILCSFFLDAFCSFHSTIRMKWPWLWNQSALKTKIISQFHFFSDYWITSGQWPTNGLWFINSYCALYFICQRQRQRNAIGRLKFITMHKQEIVCRRYSIIEQKQFYHEISFHDSRILFSCNQ